MYPTLDDYYYPETPARRLDADERIRREEATRAMQSYGRREGQPLQRSMSQMDRDITRALVATPGSGYGKAPVAVRDSGYGDARVTTRDSGYGSARVTTRDSGYSDATSWAGYSREQRRQSDMSRQRDSNRSFGPRRGSGPDYGSTEPTADADIRDTKQDTRSSVQVPKAPPGHTADKTAPTQVASTATAPPRSTSVASRNSDGVSYSNDKWDDALRRLELRREEKTERKRGCPLKFWCR